MPERTFSVGANTTAALRRDKIGQFLSAALDRQRGPHVAMAELHTVYLAYCKISGAPNIPLRQFSRQVARRGYVVSHDGAQVADAILQLGVNDFADRQRHDAALANAKARAFNDV